MSDIVKPYYYAFLSVITIRSFIMAIRKMYEFICSLMKKRDFLMSTILISIKPEYVEKIFDGNKKHEYKRRLANKAVDKMIIYCTVPVKAVVGEVAVTGIISDLSEYLWEQTKDFAGISKEKYFEYFSGKEKANCYVLSDYVKYDHPKS